MFINVFLASIVSDMGQVQLLFPFLSAIYFQKIVVALSAVGLLFDSRLAGNVKICLNSKQGWAFLFLVSWMIISFPFGIYPGGSFAFLTRFFWKTIVMFLLVLAYASTEADFDKTLWMYIVAMGLLGIWTVTASHGSRLAIHEQIYDPNDTALQFVLALPFVFWKFVSSRGIKRVLAAAISIVLLVGIVETKSRGGFLGLIAIAVVTVAQSRRYEKGRLLRMVLPLVVLIAVVLIYGSAEYAGRMSTIFHPSTDYNISSDTGRLNLWRRGIDMMLNSPFWGVGVQNFISADGRLYVDVGSRWNAAHNSFVQIGAELGFPGLIVFCFLILSSMRGVRSVRRNIHLESSGNTFGATASNSILGSWVGFVVCGFFLSAAYIGSFYFLLALSMVFISLEKQKRIVESQEIKDGL